MPGAAGSESTERAVELSPPEVRVLQALQRSSEAVEESDIPERCALPVEAVRGSLQRLRSKRLARVEERAESILRLTARGESALTQGLPERRLLRSLSTGPGVLPSEAELSAAERSAAIGILRRRGYLAEGTPFHLRPDAPGLEVETAEEAALRQIADGTAPGDRTTVTHLERRGLVRIEPHPLRRWSLTEEGIRFAVSEGSEARIGALTRELLASGAWHGATFRPYDVRAEVPFASGPRPHPYQAWLEEFEEILIGLGFEESEGPLIETEFWNGDALFMPQDHPARSVHDVLHVDGICGLAPAASLLERVATVHEGRALPGRPSPESAGWTDRYDPEVAARPVLRSQTTAVSARYLARVPPAPFRMYSIGRNFRFEAIDAQHHLEFGQCEGVLGQDGVSIRHLRGIFQSLAEAIGIRDLKVRPSYFPFTEPSIEGYVRHPRLGWIEIFPGGLLRPEVLRPLGIEVPVAAWGIGITRLAMVALGCNDIRELFQDDLETLRTGRP
ncbi:MAG: phenylalanine--tRNA ligase subunit alpha [Thermoplasmata archaeon]